MATKGENKTLKRLNAPPVRKILRKTAVFTVKGKPGAHKKSLSVPLGFAVRDLMGIVSSMREARFVLSSGYIKVNGKIVKESKLPIGLFDVIEFIKRNQKFRAMFDRKGRIEFTEINPKKELTKYVKITGKKMNKKGAVQLSTNDGRVFLEKKTDLNVGDSMQIKLPEQKVMEKVQLKEGAKAYLISGRHVGRKAVVKKVLSGTQRRQALIELQEGDSTFQTAARNIIIVGAEKEAA